MSSPKATVAIVVIVAMTVAPPRGVSARARARSSQRSRRVSLSIGSAFPSPVGSPPPVDGDLVADRQAVRPPSPEARCGMLAGLPLQRRAAGARVLLPEWAEREFGDDQPKRLPAGSLFGGELGA